MWKEKSVDVITFGDLSYIMNFIECDGFFFQNRDKGWAGQICISLETSRKVKKEKFRGLLKGSSVGVKTKSNKIK